KAVALLSTFAITVDELGYIGANAADFAGFDLNALPLAAADGHAVFAFVDALAQYAALRDSSRGSIPLIDCFTAPDVGVRATAIAALLGVNEAVGQDAIVTLALPHATVR